MHAGRVGRLHAGERAVRLPGHAWPRSSPASRSSSVSPTHTIGVIPCCWTALSFWFTDLVGLAEELAALGVPDDHVLHLELGEHRRARPRR